MARSPEPPSDDDSNEQARFSDEERSLIFANMVRFIDEVRNERGTLTHDELARLAGIPKASIKQYAQRKAIPEPVPLLLLCRIFRRPAEDVFLKHPPPRRNEPAEDWPLPIDKADETMIVARNVRAYREQLGMEMGREVSQPDLAAMTGLNRFTISRIESEYRAPKLYPVWKLAQAFRRPIAQLYLSTPATESKPDRRAGEVAYTVVGMLDADLVARVAEVVAEVNREAAKRLGAAGRARKSR